MAVGGYGMRAESPIVATVATFDLDTGKLIRPKVKFGKSRRHGNDVFTDDANLQTLQQPIAIVHDPRNSRLLVAAFGSDRIAALNTAWSDPITKPLGAWSVAQAPEVVAITSDGTKAFAHASHTYEVAELKLSSNIGEHVNQRWVRTMTGKPMQIGRNPLPEAAQKGRRLFTFALDGRLSGANRFGCASCHPDGRGDGLVWHVGVGPRQTPILADRLHGTAPFNWLGTEDKLEENIAATIKRLGGSAINKDELTSLATYMNHYMDSLDNPNRQPRDSELVAMGRDLFHSEAVGCSGCHDGDSRFTDGARHEVGTTSKIEFDLWKRFGKQKKPGGPPALRPPSSEPMPRQIMMEDQLAINSPFGFREPIAEAPVAYDTPSLKHLWASGPYYHDGSYTSLKDLLTKGNPDDKMGRTSHLAGRQIDALVAYLKTL